MISGTNESANLFKDIYDFGENDYKVTGITDVINNLIDRRNNALGGGINCIPLPFERFRDALPGVEQGQYVIVTANEKVGKSSLASYLYVYSVLDYAYDHPDQCSTHIIYFALEESIDRIIQRYMSHLLWKLDGIRISPTDLRSTSSEFPVSEEILDLLQSEPYQRRLRFFEDCVQFETEETNPTGILRVCEDYAKSVGSYKEYSRKSRSNPEKDVVYRREYTPNDRNHYKICIVDHIGLIDQERGQSLREAINKLSEYAVKYLRNRYNYTFVNIQQQAADTEGLDAIKNKKMIPSTAGLGDSKDTRRDANIVLGVFDPNRFGLPNWLGYKIDDPADHTGLKSYARFLYFLRSRDGEQGGICPLFFDGACCSFEELPKPDDINAMTQVYNRVKNMKSYRQLKKMQSLGKLSMPIAARMKKKSK